MTPLGPVRFLTFHCAATPEGRDVKAQSVSRWDIERFGQVSYHWVVELDGKAVRTLSDVDKGAHVGLHNTGNIGVCYIGGTDAAGKPKDTRTEAQKKAMAELVARYRKLVPDIIIRGHRDWPGVKKACPSFDVAAWLKEIERSEA